jgi:hypothetical protein
MYVYIPYHIFTIIYLPYIHHSPSVAKAPTAPAALRALRARRALPHAAPAPQRPGSVHLGPMGHLARQAQG